MSYPVRVQLSRAKGWRMPPHTVSVARPGIWGNPYSVERFGLPLALELYRRTVRGHWSPGGIPDELMDDAYRAHTAFRSGLHSPQDIRYMRGINLACWCKLDRPCHADILIELANA